jgi:hypothetical protein
MEEMLFIFKAQEKVCCFVVKYTFLRLLRFFCTPLECIKAEILLCFLLKLKINIPKKESITGCPPFCCLSTHTHENKNPSNEFIMKLIKATNITPANCLHQKTNKYFFSSFPFAGYQLW